MLPSPPDMLAPPITTAAIAFTSIPLPIVLVHVNNFDVNTTPTRADMTP